MVLEPGRRSEMQFSGPCRIDSFESTLEELGEQMVVAEPFLVIVDAGQEEIPTFGFLEQCLARLQAG